MTTLLILLILITTSSSQQSWEIKKDDEGIQIYTRKVPGSDFKEFRGEVIMENTTMNNIQEAILDVDGYESLFPDCYDPRILKQTDNSYSVHYLITKAPWPFKDRDGIYEQIIRVAAIDSLVTISIRILPGFIPENDQYVRIQYGVGFWEIRKMKVNTFRVIYQFHADPEERVPDWLARRFIVENPFTTLNSLRSIVKNM